MAAQAKLLELREFNLTTVWPRLAMKTKDEFDDYLADLGLLWKNRPCPNCGEPRAVTHQNVNGEPGRKKFECYRAQCRFPGSNRKTGFLKDTFFEQCHADRKKVFLVSYLFINGMGTVDDMARSCEMDPSTVVQWTTWFRDVLVEYYANNNVRMGGPNTIVQIDETNIVRRKYNRGRIVRRDWLIGGVQDGTRLVFCEITDTRDSATLDRIIQKYVAPGGTIHTDLWRGYNNLSNLGYNHQVVNHSQHFVNPATGVHTQRIESLWSQLKQKIKPKNGLKGELWDDHFAEALWKWEKNEEDLFYEFWCAVVKKYPLV